MSANPVRSYDDSDFMFEKRYMADARDRYVDSDMFVDVSRRNLPLSRWTTVSADDRLMNHLLTLFFTWDNIVERIFYRPLFEEDVIAMDPSSADHPGGFCSRFLINALLAVSCVSWPPYPAAMDYVDISAIHHGPGKFQGFRGPTK